MEILNFIPTILVFIVTLLILVLIHEFGHFFTAKKFRIKVEEFGFGIPPRAWGKKIGETIYSLNWLPFGGFVRLLGEDDLPPGDKSKVSEESRYFSKRPIWQRITVVVAGVVMNLFLAWVLFYIVLAATSFKASLPLITPHNFVGVEQKNETILVAARINEDSPDTPVKSGERIIAINDQFVASPDQVKEVIKENPGKHLKITVADIEGNNYRSVELTPLPDIAVIIGGVAENSPASQAGLKTGDRVLAVNNLPISSSPEFIDLVKPQAGNPMKLTLLDPSTNQQKVLEVTPRKDPPPEQGALGVILKETYLPNLDISAFLSANLEYKEPWQKILAGPIHSYNLASYSASVIGRLVAVSIERGDPGPVSSTVAGPVGMTSLVKEILSIQNPFIPYLNFLALLSLNLAVINVLPFPGLDGGRLFFLIVEGVTRKRVHATFEKYVHTAGLAILLTLIVLITISDISKFIL